MKIFYTCLALNLSTVSDIVIFICYRNVSASVCVSHILECLVSRETEVVVHSAAVGPSFVLCKSDSFRNNNILCKIRDICLFYYQYCFFPSVKWPRKQIFLDLKSRTFILTKVRMFFLPKL